MLSRYLVNFATEDFNETFDTNMLVIGSGIAGLFSAIKAAEYGSVIVLTKNWHESNTRYAQGGIAAVIDRTEDSIENHIDDTIRAGAGLCDLEAVRIMATEGPLRLHELIELGTHFDRTYQGHLAVTREGGHGRRRVLHSYGDQTGLEIIRSLQEAVSAHPNITILDGYYAVDLMTSGEECVGVLAIDSTNRLIRVNAQATVLATGGCGQVYRHTTNPIVTTGDGLAMAYRAGAEVTNMEFIQFHPTALALPGAPRFLISEAVRGEGGVLINGKGSRFMSEYHSMAELAPRDIVAKAMVAEMEKHESSNLYLDVTKLDLDVSKRFPKIYSTLKEFGLDCKKEYIPVAPAAHYSMGGVKVDYTGRTNISRLYACGEVACCGLHGANRLASNSLLDGLVFAHRIAEDVKTITTSQALCTMTYHTDRLPDALTSDEVRIDVQTLMWKNVGLVRSCSSLSTALRELSRLSLFLGQKLNKETQFETANLLTVATLITRSALWREESRGSHYRTDCPHPNPKWRFFSLLRR